MGDGNQWIWCGVLALMAACGTTETEQTAGAEAEGGSGMNADDERGESAGDESNASADSTTGTMGTTSVADSAATSMGATSMPSSMSTTGTTTAGSTATTTDGTTSSTASTSGTSSSDGSTTEGGSDESSGGPVGVTVPYAFVEDSGMVVFEVEHYTAQTNTEPTATYWYAITEDGTDCPVQCVTNTPCNNGNRPQCNEHSDCDGDSTPASEAANGVYLESLPDRRRTDDEANTGNLGIVNNPDTGPRLDYEIEFTETGRYYVWVRARGQGPAANGLHVGLDGEWPRNELTDPSSMRLQFGNGWRWNQNRRGGSNHTGVPATDTVSRRDANIWLEIDTPGVHTVSFSMREDGVEIDKVVMTTDDQFDPDNNDLGPAETLAPLAPGETYGVTPMCL